MGLRLRVWARSLEFDRRLAEGVRPACSPELSLRARQLVSARSRRELSGALRSALEAAARPPAALGPQIPVSSTGVLEAAEPLGLLAWDLAATPDPPVRGVALLSFLLCDPMSPLYNRHARVSVREIAEQASAALRCG
jgi:hypothetical protein